MNQTHLVTGCFVLVVLLSGCTGLLGSERSDAADTPEPTLTETATPTQTQTPTPTATDTPTPTPVPKMTFAIAEAQNETRARQHLRSAVDRWEGSEYQVGELEIVESQTTADVEVVVTHTIEACKGETTDGTFFWCYEDGRLEIVNRYIEEQTREFVTRGVGFAAGIEDPDDTELTEDYGELKLKSPFVGSDPIRVALVSEEIDVTARDGDALDRTIAYWNQNSGEFGLYPARFERVSNPEEADILVTMVTEIEDCGGKSDAVGCAPILTRTAPADTPITVQIESGYTQSNTTAIMKHEFGHVLGLTHTDEPQSVMKPGILTFLAGDITDLSEREYAFEESTLSVYIDYDSFATVPDDKVRSEITTAIEWYEAGNVDATPADFEMELVENRDEAHLIVEKNNTACAGSFYWCTLPYGTDLDGDSTLEYYTRAYIYMERDVGAQLAYNFAKGAGFAITSADSADDAPPRGVPRSEQSQWPDN